MSGAARRWIVVLIVAGAVVAAVAWQAARPDAEVAVIRPQRQTLRAYVEERAVTELPHDTLISMPISSWLEPITLREGDTVEAGQLVARLDTADLSDRVEQIEQRIANLQTQIAKSADNRLEDNMLVEAEATVKVLDQTVKAAELQALASKAVADFAKFEVDRLKKLSEQGTATDRELREAEMTWRRASAEHQSDLFELAAIKTVAAVSHIGPKFIRDYTSIKSYDRQRYEQQIAEARAELEIAKRNVARAEITSPVDGVVLTRHQTRRQYLAAGTPLLTIGRLDDIEVIAEVLTERATQISPGDPVEVYGQAIPEGPLAGKVWRVYPAGFRKISSLGVEQQRVNVAVRLDQRPERLGVGFRVHVRIFYDEAPDALTLPRTALYRSADGEWQVMLVRDGLTVVQTVAVGLTNDDLAQISDGLSADNDVVANPSRDIRPGMEVTVRRP